MTIHSQSVATVGCGAPQISAYARIVAQSLVSLRLKVEALLQTLSLFSLLETPFSHTHQKHMSLDDAVVELLKRVQVLEAKIAFLERILVGTVEEE